MPTTLTSRTSDLLAGISLAGLLLPEAVAYAGLANLPPQAGVVALFAGLICYGVIGRSRYAVVSATSSSAAVPAAATFAVAGVDAAQRVALAGLLVVGSGVAFIVFGALRLGALSNLVARPVLRGYGFGLALVIIVRQWPHLVGLPAQAGGFFALLGEPLLAQARQQVRRDGNVKLVVLSLEESPDLDGTALEVLREFCDWLEARGITIRVARLKDEARDALVRAKLTQLPAPTLDFSSVDDAVRGECPQ